MAEVTKSMLKDSIDAYVNEDVALAKQVRERDDTVDDYKVSITQELIRKMCADCEVVDVAIQLMVIARNLERVADLSTNIGENVTFMVEGKVVKHQSFD
jgi:phosphate transport system protein